VPPEHVDRPSLPTDREGDLDGDLPAERSQAGDDEIDDRDVRFVEKPVQGLAVPGEREIGSRPELARDRDQGSEGNCVDLTMLDPADGALRPADRRRDVALAEVASNSKGTNRPTESNRVDRSRLPRLASLPLNPRSSGGRQNGHWRYSTACASISIAVRPSPRSRAVRSIRVSSI
jgi:hypothetical protein